MARHALRRGAAAVGTAVGFVLTIGMLLRYERQRRAGDEALSISEEKFRTLVNNINYAVYRTEPSGRYLEANPAMARIFGHKTPEALIATPVSDLYQDVADRVRLFEQLEAKGAVKDVEMAMKKKDGTPIWTCLTAAVQRDDAGAILWADGVMEDITERKKAREELKKAQAELEARVARRTSELSIANERLRQRNLETSVLYQVSSAISRSISMEGLLTEVLDTIASLEVFKIDKGGIFVVEGDHMRMVANVGHSESFVRLHEDMHVGDCLCGQVARTGKILISTNSATDPRHTIVDADASAHGHLIVPLKTKDQVEGVLDLYMPVDGTVEEDELALLSAIGNQLGVAIENAKLYDKAKELSLRDSLTGLWNHEEVLRILELELTRAEREGGAVSVIMADLDQFKEINDTFGHLSGDAVLCSTADKMRSLFRPYDAIGRYGGDEIVIALPGSDINAAEEIAERLRKAIEDDRIETTAGVVQVTMSLGVAASHSAKRRDAKSQIRAADLALYRAKESGGNRVELASDAD